MSLADLQRERRGLLCDLTRATRLLSKLTDPKYVRLPDREMRPLYREIERLNRELSSIETKIDNYRMEHLPWQQNR